MSKKRDLSKLPEYLLGNASAMADTAETCNKIVSTVNSLVPGFAATGVAAAMSSPVVAGLVFVTMTSLNLWGQWREAKDESKREAVVARLLQAVSDPYQTAAKLARERGLDQLPAIVDEPNNWMLVLDALISEQGRQVREQLEKNLAPILSRLEVIEETVTASHVLLTELHDRWVVSHQEEKGAPNWTIPRPNPSFTGQEAYLERLRTTLGGGTVTGITQPAGLSGFGGIGKTELALAYAQVFGQDYSAGYFIVADSTPALDFGLAKIGVPGLLEDADDTTIQSARHEALQQLASRDKLLLILDNVDEIVQTDALSKVFLALPTAHIILTCRHRDMGSNTVLVEVDKLDEQTGALYVLREGMGNETMGPWKWEDFPESEREGALALSRELDGLPLALHHAGCAMRGESLTAHEVLESYRANRKRLLANRGNVGSVTHPDSVVVTVSLALERLQNKDPAAAELVICCAFLAPTGMFEWFFTENLLGMGSVLAESLTRFDDVRRLALASGLVQRIAAEKRLVMHRLTQAVILDLPGANAETRLGDISNLATKRLFEKGLYRMAIAQGEYSISEARSFLGDHDPETLTSMNNLASTYWSMGRHGDALSLEEEVLSVSKSVLGDHHPATLTSMGNLASTYWSMGRHRHALTLEEEVLSVSKSVLGDHHPATLTSMGNLASTYWSMGRHRHALTLEEEVLQLRKSVLGDHHPATLTSVGNLASTYWSMGRHGDALSLMEEVLALQKTVLGDHHPETLTSMHNLARTYWSMGRHGDALSLMEEVLALQKTVLGDHHPETLTSMHNLASTYWSMGRHGEALTLQEEVLQLRKSVLGDHHPNTLISMGNLAGTYRSMGRHGDALALQEEVLSLHKSVLGDHHPDTLISMGNLASTYASYGRHEDALSLREEVLSLHKSALGGHHPNTLISMGNLAGTYRSMGRHGDALALQEEVLSLHKSVLGDHHPDTLISMGNLASTYASYGRHEDALSLREEVLSLHKSALGGHHPFTLTSMNNLAGTYFSLGRLQDSAELMQACLKALESVLGVEHPDTIQTRANLDIVLAAIAERDGNS